MKCLLLIYSNPVNWEHPIFLNQEELTPAERQARLKEHNGLVEEIAESGELIDAATTSTRVWGPPPRPAMRAGDFAQEVF
ncbi:hypothetical protein [Nonomuraea diastatica]|uniref:hypothetical protein n=1 Tax=Nonomuraea diastatica TaxID=1848329 RepID=UPI00140DA639|nr:hypothetical protein [Nonomuraea diastatica]